LNDVIAVSPHTKRVNGLRQRLFLFSHPKVGGFVPIQLAKVVPDYIVLSGSKNDITQCLYAEGLQGESPKENA
jgi:hypothetical protein